MADAVLLIDDDVDVLRAGGAQLERAGYEVTRELSGEAGLSTWDRIRPDIVVLDLDLPGMAGTEVLQHLRERSAAVIVLAPAGSSAAVAALQAGAESWVLKPVDQAHLEAAIGRVAETVRLRRVAVALLGPAAGQNLESLGGSSSMQEIAQQVRLLAGSERTTVLLEGEVGSGKGWVARLIHALSARSRQPANIASMQSSGNPPVWSPCRCVNANPPIDSGAMP